MNTSLQILMVGEQTEAEDEVASLLRVSAFELICVSNSAECVAYLSQLSAAPGLILWNPATADGDTLEAIRSLRASHPQLPMAVTGNRFDPPFIEEASKSGAFLLMKPISSQHIQGLINHIRRKSPLAEVPANSDVYIEELQNDSFFLAASPAMHGILSTVNIIASADVPVLITGETGVGKEVVAQLLHHRSSRARRPMLKVNCAALPNDLLESELFGFEAGAFTGATKAKPGKFDLCDKGTILLDEIGEMSPQMQAKLLHVLQDGEFARLGSRSSTKVDVRVIAATNIDMERCISDRSFREDLYYRLSVFVLHIPPLRERRQEIPYLLHEMSRRMAASFEVEPIAMCPRLIAASLECNWAGNLRELGNFVKRHLILRDEVAAVVELESRIMQQRATTFPPAKNSDTELSIVGLKSMVRATKMTTETQMIRDVLRQNRWNRRIAAEQLKISYKALLYKIREYQLDVPGAA
jgi:two-component system response regulator AtoC